MEIIKIKADKLYKKMLDSLGVIYEREQIDVPIYVLFEDVSSKVCY